MCEELAALIDKSMESNTLLQLESQELALVQCVSKEIIYLISWLRERNALEGRGGYVIR